MKILMLTPLYPPDIADPAPYVKELARRLKTHADITIIAYGHIPEKIDGVTIIAIEKSSPLLFRLISYFTTLLKHVRHTDIVYVQNGPSTELPVSLVSLITRTPYILRLGDEAALMFATKKKFMRIIQHFAISRAQSVILHSENLKRIMHDNFTTTDVHVTDRPKERPEILPFTEKPENSLSEYEASWNKHIQELTKLFDHG